MKKNSFEILCVQELSSHDLMNLSGGGPIRRFVTWLLCDCEGGRASEMVHNTMIRRGI